MPEGDAVLRTARRLDAALSGKRITDWDLRWPSVATSDHRGAVTVEVVARGKHILHRLDDGTTLHTHLRMDGRWLVKDPTAVTRGDLANHRLRALVGTATTTALGLELGMVDVVATTRETDLVGHLGPDLLGPDWDPGRAARNLRRHPDAMLGTALLDQRNLAGIGTIWLAETSFAERLSPFTLVRDLDDDRLLGIVTRAHRLLTRSMDFPFATSTGDPRRPTYVYGRHRERCIRCRTPIAVSEIPGGIGLEAADRLAWYCPTCQPLPRRGPEPPHPGRPGW